MRESLSWYWYRVVVFVAIKTNNARLLDYAADLFERGVERKFELNDD